MNAAQNQQDPYGIDVAACRTRQQRLLEFMWATDVDLALITRIENIQWLAGPRFNWCFAPCAALDANGRFTLAAPNAAPDAAAAHNVVSYPAQRLATLRNDQAQASAAALREALGGEKVRRLAVEFSACGPHYTSAFAYDALVDIEPEVYRLRRQKDPDELARIRKAIAGTGAMYTRARAIIRPGISEIEVFNQLQAAAVEELGEMLTGTGNDYSVGAQGGPPRRGALAEAGQLYILDLGPAFRGYFADNCRTFSVDRKPTPPQLEAWQRIVEVHAMVQETIRPGLSCKQLYHDAKAMLENTRSWTFPHHLGHGIGLFPHEAPHLNPHWDDVLEVGEVVAVEPGLYSPELNPGIRIENNYLVTGTGAELLSPFPLEL